MGQIRYNNNQFLYVQVSQTAIRYYTCIGTKVYLKRSTHPAGKKNGHDKAFTYYYVLQGHWRHLKKNRITVKICTGNYRRVVTLRGSISTTMGSFELDLSFPTATRAAIANLFGFLFFSSFATINQRFGAQRPPLLSLTIGRIQDGQVNEVLAQITFTNYHDKTPLSAYSYSRLENNLAKLSVAEDTYLKSKFQFAQTQSFITGLFVLVAFEALQNCLTIVFNPFENYRLRLSTVVFLKFYSPVSFLNLCEEYEW